MINQCLSLQFFILNECKYIITVRYNLLSSDITFCGHIFLLTSFSLRFICISRKISERNNWIQSDCTMLTLKYVSIIWARSNLQHHVNIIVVFNRTLSFCNCLLRFYSYQTVIELKLRVTKLDWLTIHARLISLILLGNLRLLGSCQIQCPSKCWTHETRGEVGEILPETAVMLIMPSNSFSKVTECKLHDWFVISLTRLQIARIVFDIQYYS